MRCLTITVSIILLLCTQYSLYAQDNRKIDEIDSLEEVVTYGTRVEQTIATIRLTYLLGLKCPDEALQYGKMSIKLAKEQGIDSLIVDAYEGLYLSYSDWGQYVESLKYSQELLQIQKDRGIKDISATYEGIGFAYANLKEYDKAFQLYQEALKLSREKEDRLNETIALSNIGTIYIDQGDYNRACMYIEKSREISGEIGDKVGLAYADFEMGDIAYRKGDLDEAIEYLYKANNAYESLVYDEYFDEERSYVLSGINLAYALTDKGDYSKAAFYFHESLRISYDISDKNSTMESYMGLGYLQVLTDSLDVALSSFDKGLSYAKLINRSEVEADFYASISHVYEKKGQKDKALTFYKKYKALSDSTFLKDMRVHANLKVLQIDAERKEKEFAQQNERRILEEAKLKSERIKTLSYISGILLLLIVAIVAIIRMRHNKRVNKMLLSQKEEIEEKNMQLHDANRIKDRFFSIISHDLKSPFKSLDGILTLMGSNALSSKEVNRLFKELKVKFDSTNYLLENLLEWARMQMQDTKFEPKDIELHSAIEAELQVVKNSRSKDIDLKNGVDKVSLAYADVNMLKLIIRNLVNNAVKFTESEGSVEVISEDLGEFVCISVKDDGVGISKENQKKLFKDETSFTTLGTELESGTGLGLNLCKEFVKMHGGKIWVESEEGKGSIFKFTLKKAS